MLSSFSTALREGLSGEGFSTAAGGAMAGLLQIPAQDWRAFATSWNDLEPDTHMADQGRYRRRRYGVVTLTDGAIAPQTHQPHYQSRDANPLNGGVDRWFAPISPARLLSRPMTAIFDLCRPVFGLDGADPEGWKAQIHQFRIEARAAEAGLPTPEGVHRDGVDWAFVMLIDRCNAAGGVTTIFDPARRPLGAFTLADPMDAVFIDDHRIFHGVTAITPIDAAALAYRDVLVVTFARL